MGEVDIAVRHDVGALYPVIEPSIAVINSLAIGDLISVDAAIILVRQAMRDLSSGRIDAPARWAMPVNNNGLLALMPGAVRNSNRFGIKVLSLFDAPDGHPPVPGHQGLMLLFDSGNGRPLSIIDAGTLTGLRTAAASAVATDVLARPDSKTVAMIGCGEQARWHVRALRCVRAIEDVRVWSRSPANTRDLAADVERQGMRVKICETVQDTITGADIVCTVTRSRDPVISGDWLAPGQHLNLVGSSTSLAREVDEKAVARARFIVDSRVNALSQGGELRAAIAAGAVTTAHVHAEIGEVLANEAQGREDAAMITIYKSLGHVAQDLAVAIALHEGAAQSSHTTWAAW
jgi:ornithine cyclodeaminase/alanine dehydrogenase-like protein (mu-crystallin family)